MTVAVLVPWTPGCPHREDAWSYVRFCYQATHPEWEIVTGASPDGPYSRSAAILDAFHQTTADTLVVADADVWCNPADAVDQAAQTGWAIPHTLVHRLSRESTGHVLEGASWRGLPLSTENRQDSRPDRGHLTGTLVVLRRDVMLDVPPDPRFRGWGQEDDAWADALLCLVGKPWRGTADLVHLWHPAQPRMTRIVGNPESLALRNRYKAARRHPEQMRALIAEATVPA